MCGILGVVDRKGVSAESLSMMRDAMVHRGPDDAGIWLNSDRTVGLAHRRLSIIDLSHAGRQPMADSDGKIRITFNGEIYNFQTLKKELGEIGYSFRSNTDTEVIMNAYHEWGTDCLQKLNGMFAFGLYDENRRVLFLARDRLGKKPLYYSASSSERRFSFASEIKAMLKDQSISRDLDLQALNHYFTFGFVPDDLSIFRSVRKLPPAHAMIYHTESGKKDIWRYWDVPEPSGQIRTEEDLLSELESLLKDAVRLRMISDVPLGAFLSGGVDSSLVVAMMSMVSDRPVKTFSIGFEDSNFNELPYARIVAEHFGTEHTELIVRPDMFSILPDLVRQFDEPFADSSMLPTYYVSKVTREKVTVALSGDGGDEIFGGYNLYRAGLFDYYMRLMLPEPVRKGIAWSSRFLPEKGLARVKSQLSKLQYTQYESLIERCSEAYFKTSYRTMLLSSEARASLNSRFLEPEGSRLGLFENRHDGIIDRMSYVDLHTYLPNDILVKVDRASMLASLEVRAPLLDYRIAEFSFRNVPDNMKIHGSTAKYLLKRLAGKILPQTLDINRKWGFAVPVADWFRGPLSTGIRDTLLGTKNVYFDQACIRRLLDEHSQGRDHSLRLFSLLVYYLWEREYLKV
ncbi:MAG: asparagine synthase (glutamine-hydrolyzing) [Nitrospirae bacterium]|nr:asparagine synthase (glutamine-hydrolyzing) [Nitrospirota bacterium]